MRRLSSDYVAQLEHGKDPFASRFERATRYPPTNFFGWDSSSVRCGYTCRMSLANARRNSVDDDQSARTPTAAGQFISLNARRGQFVTASFSSRQPRTVVVREGSLRTRDMSHEEGTHRRHVATLRFVAGKDDSDCEHAKLPRLESRDTHSRYDGSSRSSSILLYDNDSEDYSPLQQEDSNSSSSAFQCHSARRHTSTSGFGDAGAGASARHAFGLKELLSFSPHAVMGAAERTAGRSPDELVESDLFDLRSNDTRTSLLTVSATAFCVFDAERLSASGGSGSAGGMHETTAASLVSHRRLYADATETKLRNATCVDWAGANTGDGGSTMVLTGFSDGSLALYDLRCGSANAADAPCLALCVPQPPWIGNFTATGRQRQRRLAAVSAPNASACTTRAGLLSCAAFLDQHRVVASFAEGRGAVAVVDTRYTPKTTTPARKRAAAAAVPGVCGVPTGRMVSSVTRRPAVAGGGSVLALVDVSGSAAITTLRGLELFNLETQEAAAAAGACAGCGASFSFGKRPQRPAESLNGRCATDCGSDRAIGDTSRRMQLHINPYADTLTTNSMGGAPARGGAFFSEHNDTFMHLVLAPNSTCTTESCVLASVPVTGSCGEHATRYGLLSCAGTASSLPDSLEPAPITPPPRSLYGIADLVCVEDADGNPTIFSSQSI